MTRADPRWCAPEPPDGGEGRSTGVASSRTRRSQLGAHYTGRDDIARVVEPVLMTPLRRRRAGVQTEADKLKAAWDAPTTPQTRKNRRDAFASALFAFQEELASVRVLDPACGNGNFLYVALAAMQDLEKEIVTPAVPPIIQVDRLKVR